MKPRLVPLGDSAILVQLGEAIDPALNRQVHALDVRLREFSLPGVIETVPAYASVLIHYDPVVLTYAQVSDWIKGESDQAEAAISRPPRRIEVPVRYGGEAGPDLEFVATYHKVSPETVARLHASRDYLVYMMGFTPGFPYLGKLEAAIATPRLETPRTRVPAGSVGIAGEQTGIYPVESPGGWRLIGRTALSIFNLASEPPFLFSPGDSVRFVIEAVDA
jgi:KipI family sensor histidine kinase inhibitor